MSYANLATSRIVLLLHPCPQTSSDADQLSPFHFNHSSDILTRLPSNSMELHFNIQGSSRPRIIDNCLQSHFPRYYLRQGTLVYKSDSCIVNLILKINQNKHFLLVLVVTYLTIFGWIISYNLSKYTLFYIIDK